MSSFAQRKAVCITKFVPHQVTYNASPDPRQCWEAVDHGILVKAENVEGFFFLAPRDLDRLITIIGNADVEVEVIYYEEDSSGSGETIGSVSKIMLQGKILYSAVE